ncbi:hypothetical protein [Pseudarthrobacter sp. AB1]|uniref:hypothetical protein n=1 Tax=Pseudarthrobacter sp. AB1 TaxID=2138309 RepID=UPI00186B8120|nr:hypothetical protein [Pseudarthrobacter sp. AB1]MBE4720079.1 hypothetical protein [Pseudarthrobacter sp. AB1]
MRQHQAFSNVATITAVLSFLLAVTGILDLPMTSSPATGPGAVSHTIASSRTEAAEGVSLRYILSGDTVVAANKAPGRQPVPSRTGHCPMNLGLSVACPDVLSSAVLAASVPGSPGSAPPADTAAQPAGALPEVPGAPLHPVSLIRLSISRV